MGEDGLVELSDAIGVVRKQLINAQLDGQREFADQVLTFAVGKVSIEFSGEIKTVGGASGGVRFWVITAEGKAERSIGATHKVTVELIPQTPEGASFVVADDIDAPPEN